MPRTELSAISPLDGRYRNLVEDLVPFSSEAAHIRTRVEVEATYLLGLSEIGFIRPFTDGEKEFLSRLGPALSDSETDRIKELERLAGHDIKAVERGMREFLTQTTLGDVVDMIHFGLTSEDVKNLSNRMLLDRAQKEVCVPVLDNLVNAMSERALAYASVPMLGRTHGQDAVPTTMGKELVNFAVRLHKELRKLETVKLTGKLNGAVGNFNAFAFAAPEVDWISFSGRFIQSLGLTPNLFTTQINPYEDMIELFQTFQRINGVILDFNQDMWRYISDGWFVQEVRSGQVGSSTMPQKVNPIDFENSEGNLQMANGIWDVMIRELPISRLQRDLSDSTLMQNVGVGLAHGVLGYRRSLEGLKKISPNKEKINEVLNENWSILTEGVQTILRLAGEKDPYSTISSLSHGRHIAPAEWQAWVIGLPVAEDVKEALRELTPETYIGYAQKLTELGVQYIRDTRKNEAK